MFDLLSFIRQYLPPTLRQPITIGLVRVLFTPILTVFEAIAQAKNDIVGAATATGQVAVLEDLLNQATFGSGVGSVYILEGDHVTYDFQVLVPLYLPIDTLNTLRRLIDTHKLAGKRYRITSQVVYASDQPVAPAFLSWATGFPYMTDGVLHYAVNERGTFHTTIQASDGNLVFDFEGVYGGATDDHFHRDLDPTLSYTVTILNLSTTVRNTVSTAPPAKPTGLVKMGYSRFEGSHQTSLWFVSDRLYKVTLSLVSGSASGDGWQTDVARTIDANQTLREWTDGLRVNPTANGQGGILSGVTYYILITELDGSKPFTVAWTPQNTDTNGIIEIPLTPTTKPSKPANRPPVVANAIPATTITDHGDQVVNVPPNAFSDPDGDALTLSASGLSAGITFDASSRQFRFVEGVANGTYNLIVTASDPFGGSVPTPLSVIVNRAQVGTTNLDALLGPKITYVGRVDVGYNSHPDRWGIELVPNSLTTFNGTQFAKIRQLGAYGAPSDGVVKLKLKERYYNPDELPGRWIECGKPAVLKEYHTRGTDPLSWDDARNFYDLSFEIGFVIN